MDLKHQKIDDKLTAQLTAIQVEIDELEIEREKQRNDPARDPRGAGGMAWDASVSGWRPVGPTGGQLHGRTVPWAPGPRYVQMFGASAAGDSGGFKSFAEFCAGLEAGMWDQRYQASLGGSSNDMGLLIPGHISGELLDSSLEGEVVRPRARIYPMTSDSRMVAGFTVGGDGAPFGITGGWTPQLGTIGEVDPDRRAFVLNARKLAVITQVGNETIADGMAIPGDNVDRQLSEALPRGIGWLLDRAFLRGTGAGQPCGAISSANPARILVAKESGQEADTILYENLVAMFARMHPAHVGRSVWVANPTTIPQLLTLGHMVGIGGAPVPVLREDGTGGFTILTRPAIFTEKVPTLGDEGDISLVDFSQYAVGLRADVRLEKSGHAGFKTDSTYYRAILRADGMPTWHEPYTPDSGDTLSPFVTLAERA